MTSALFKTEDVFHDKCRKRLTRKPKLTQLEKVRKQSKFKKLHGPGKI